MGTAYKPVDLLNYKPDGMLNLGKYSSNRAGTTVNAVAPSATPARQQDQTAATQVVDTQNNSDRPTNDSDRPTNPQPSPTEADRQRREREEEQKPSMWESVKSSFKGEKGATNFLSGVAGLATAAGNYYMEKMKQDEESKRQREGYDQQAALHEQAIQNDIARRSTRGSEGGSNAQRAQDAKIKTGYVNK